MSVGVAAAILALGAGPAFSGLYTYGLSMTPYTHGSVISPSVVTIGALGLAALFLGERIGAWRVLGTITVLAGLVLVAGGDFLTLEGPAFSAYDVLFVGSGLLWASYTVLLRRWRIDPIAATAAVAVVLGMALLDEWPISPQATGVAVATVGLTLASGVVQPRQS